MEILSGKILDEINIVNESNNRLNIDRKMNLQAGSLGCRTYSKGIRKG